MTTAPLHRIPQIGYHHQMRKPSKQSNPAQPLSNQRHESFALAVAEGATLVDAHELAGFARNRTEAWKLRHRPEVDGRIRWLAKARVEASTRKFATRKKTQGDLLAAATKRLADIAFLDPGELINWERTPIVNAEGEVTGYESALQVKDSAKLTAAQRAAVKGAFLKSGALRLELHDSVNALVNLHKLLSGKDAPPSGSLVINQTNVGDVPALEAARKVAFLIAAARAQAAPLVTIEATPVRNSKETDTTQGP